jgi:hypothetical protein
MASRWWVPILLVVLVGCGTGDTVETPVVSPATSTTSSSTTVASTAGLFTTTTTTAAVAPEPPTLEITDPQPDAVVTSAVYIFRGRTDPGCTVDVGGRYFAHVDADGSWTLDLVLRPGGNTTTITATDKDGAKTDVQVSLTYAPIVLSSDGLGIVSFDDPVAEVVAILTGLLGPASYDQVEESPFEVPWEGGWSRGDSGPDACHAVTTGYICFDYIRFMAWETAGLWVIFSDLMVNEEANLGGDGGWVKVPPSLQGYSYRGGDVGPVAYAAHGITIGSTVTELQALGDLVTFHFNACGDSVDFAIADPDGTNEGDLGLS